MDGWMDYLLAILNATLCVHATEHNIYRVTQIEFKKMDEVGFSLIIQNLENQLFVLQIDVCAVLLCVFNCNPMFWNHIVHKRHFDLPTSFSYI